MNWLKDLNWLRGCHWVLLAVLTVAPAALTRGGALLLQPAGEGRSAMQQSHIKPNYSCSLITQMLI
jgi:hypothetical protein